jgi:hypothetical protein
MASVINHTGLCVSDAVRSRRFYENVFGFTHRNTLKVEDEPAARLLHVAARESGITIACRGGSRLRDDHEEQG